MRSSFQFIEDRLGETLERSNVLAHCFEGTINALLTYQLVFSSFESIIIRTGSDGESLNITTGILEENDIGEYGVAKIFPVPEYDPALIHQCLGLRFDRCRIAVIAHKTLAVEFCFEGKFISFYNLDDNMAFGGALEHLNIRTSARLIELAI
jgi:hypothetical protein